MEQEKDETASTLCMEGLVLNDDVGPADNSAKPSREGGANSYAGASDEVQREVVVATEEQFQSVFSNSLITDKIMSYLDFADIKTARQVSRHFLEMIETYKRFKDSQVLLITPENPPLNEFNFALATNGMCCWRGLRIDVFKMTGQVWRIPSVILKNVQFVSLYSTYNLTPLVRDIRYILNSTPKILHLQLGLHLFYSSNLEDVFSCSAVQGNLKDLTRLDILGWNYRVNGNSGCTFHHGKDYDDKLATSLDLLSSILQRLQSLRIAKMILYQRLPKSPTVMLKLIQRNHATLRELSVHLDFWEQEDISNAVKLMKLPHLRILTVTVWKTGQDLLKEFLVNHDNTLDEVAVTVKEEFRKNLFDVLIKQRCSKVRKLHLKAKKFVDFVGGREQMMDWTFLGTLTRLKDFQLRRPYCKNNANLSVYGNGRCLLECLPRSQLDRLSFRGIGGRNSGGFWRNNDLEDEPPLSLKLDLLRGFLNLRRLSLRHCRDAVDDDLMRFISMEMTSLVEFEVSHCSKLTDAGFMGTSEDASSDSIRNLRGLKELTIFHCPLVTPEGLLSTLKLPFLRRLDYIAAVDVSNSFVLGIISQNPSLKTLAVNMMGLSSEVLKEIDDPQLTIDDMCGFGSGSDSDSDADRSDRAEESESEESDAE